MFTLLYRRRAISSKYKWRTKCYRRSSDAQRQRDSLNEAPTFNARRFASANSLNLNTNNGIQYGRRSLDKPPTPSAAATECYAPSEVSIDWSVTTAKGFDRVSVSNFSISASEVGTAAFLQQQEAGDGGRRKGSGGGGGLLLMSCRLCNL